MKISLKELLVGEAIDKHYLAKINTHFVDLIKIQRDWRPPLSLDNTQVRINNPTPEENLFVMGVDNTRQAILTDFIAEATTEGQMRAIMIALTSYFKQLAIKADFRGLNLTPSKIQRKLDLMALHDYAKAYFDIYQEEILES